MNFRRKWMVYLPVFVSFLLILPGISFSAELTGRGVMEMQKKRHGSDDELELQKMTLTDKSGSQKIRRLKRYARKGRKGLYKFLVTFTEPSDIRGTSLLTWENEKREDDQWLYLPATRRMRRIAGGGKKNPFMGTDFAYEDLRPEDLDAHKYTILGEDTIDGHKTYIIKALPATKKEKRASGYGMRKMWIRKDIFFTVKIEYYSRRGKLVKVQTNRGLSNVKGAQWRADSVEMKTLKENHKTVTETAKRYIDKGMKESIFTERAIKRGKTLR